MYQDSTVELPLILNDYFQLKVEKEMMFSISFLCILFILYDFAKEADIIN